MRAKRKPAPNLKASREWREQYGNAIRKLNELRAEIDSLGEDGDWLILDDPAGPEQRMPDEIACYASNCLEGVRSLMSDLWQRVVNQGDPNK